MFVRLLAALGIVALAACGSKQPAAQPTPTPKPLLIDDRGIVMPLDKVMRQVAFRPYLPMQGRQVFAALPPLGGADTRATRGLGVEYSGKNGAQVVRSEWPAQSFTIRFGKHDLSASPCTLAEYDPGKFAFTTKTNLVETVQGDTGSSRADVQASAQEALVQACGVQSKSPAPKTR